VLLLLISRSLGPEAQACLPLRLKRNCLILGLAGPINLLIWLLFNQYLDQVGYRSVVGYMLAAIVFIVMGFITGFFSRLTRKADIKDE